ATTTVLSLGLWLLLSACPLMSNRFSGDFDTILVAEGDELSEEDLGEGVFWGTLGTEDVSIGVDSEVSFAFSILVTEDDAGNPIDPLYQTVIIDEERFVLIQTDGEAISANTTIVLAPGSSNIVVLFELAVNPDNPTQITATPVAYSQSGTVSYRTAGSKVGDTVSANFEGVLKEIGYSARSLPRPVAELALPAMLGPITLR
ncbi:MAG: hypothetical protein D6795_08535, partial [Deltaproteobacteria bacterium]